MLRTLTLLAMLMLPGSPIADEPSDSPAAPQVEAQQIEGLGKRVLDPDFSDRGRLRAADQLASSPSSTALDYLLRAIDERNASDLLRTAWISLLPNSPQHDRVTEFLVRKLGQDEESTEIRVAAATQLGLIGGTESRAALTQALDADEMPIRLAAQRGLAANAEGSDDRTSALIAVLENRQQPAGARVAAARELGNLGNRKALSPLIGVLGEQGSELPGGEPTNFEEYANLQAAIAIHVPLAAIKALGKLGDHGAVPALLPMSRAKDAQVRTETFEALVNLRAAEGIPAAIQALKNDESHRARRWAGVLLKELAPPESAPDLLAAMDDTDPGVRLQVAQALGRLRYAPALPRLREALPNEELNEVREAVAHAIEAIEGAPPAVQQQP